MVNIDIPQKHAAASWGDGTPRLTINHEAAFELDSTNAFEGMCGPRQPSFGAEVDRQSPQVRRSS